MTRLKIIAAIFFPVILSFDSKAQFFDSLSASFRTKPKIFFQFDAYNSFVSDKGASTFGYKAGVEFNNHIKFGIGYNTLTSDIVKDQIVTYTIPDSRPEQSITDTLPAQLVMKFVPLLFEYIFYNEDPWQISVPLNIGMGKTFWRYYKQQKNNKGEYEEGKFDEKTVVPMTINAEVQYKVIKWAGVGAGLGFRKMIKGNPADENFNSVIYSLRLRLFVDEIYKSLFPKKN
ncbi:MAG TPA: hypothetical protein VJY62_02680 [Bacteroidia bacterium]|nr:hypothetical protein [Bacteroidia bacterium]